MVNLNARRFLDEGEDFPLYTYVKIGKILLTQPRAWACQIMDQKCIPLLQIFYRNAVPVTADTIEELADKLGLDPEALAKTVAEYNNAVQDGPFDPSKLDGKHTEGIEPAKTMVKREMEAAAELLVPLRADLKWGPNWGAMSA